MEWMAGALFSIQARCFVLFSVTRAWYINSMKRVCVDGVVAIPVSKCHSVLVSYEPATTNVRISVFNSVCLTLLASNNP